MCQRDLKQDILFAGRQLKSSSLYIDESLTKTCSIIMYVLQRANKKFHSKVSGIGSLDGRVCVCVKSHSPKTQRPRNSQEFINTKSELQELRDNVLEAPFNSIIQNWTLNCVILYVGQQLAHTCVAASTFLN